MAKSKLTARELYESSVLQKKLQAKKEKNKRKKKKKKDKQKLKLDIINSASASKDLTFSFEDFKDIMPTNFTGRVSRTLLTEVNHLITNSDTSEQLYENIVTFSHVMETGTWSAEQYINAVRYCTFRTMDYSKKDAYMNVFPAKWKQIKKKANQQINGIVAAYNRSKLVQKIMAQVLIPQHFFYQDVFHKAVLKQTALLNSKNETIAQRAADSLMGHLTPPQEAEMTLDITSKSAQLMGNMLDNLMDISNKQRELTKAKVITPEDALRMQFIDGESKVKDE